MDMKKYGIKVEWNGTIIYVIDGFFETKEAAFEAAKENFRWFKKDPDINEIVECERIGK
jgi:hypothetical protein